MQNGICPQCGEPWQTERAYPVRRFCSKRCQIAWANALKAQDLEKRRRQARESHARHREANNARRMQYHQEHREEALPKFRQWYQDHRDEELPKHRAWHHANREQANAGRQERYWANPKEGRRKGRDYLQKSRLSDPWLKLLNGARVRAKKKQIPYDLTIEWAKAHWTGSCEVSGLPFVLGQQGSGPKFWSPSIDRIVPSLGYVRSNCRFVLTAINCFKHNSNDSDMLLVAQAIVEKNSIKSIA